VRTGSRQPVRTCVGCGGSAAQHELLRLQVSPDGRMVVVAPGGARAGRSAYVHGRRDCVDRLAKSRLLRRSLRIAVERGACEQIARTLRETLREETTVGETETTGQVGNG